VCYLTARYSRTYSENYLSQTQDRERDDVSLTLDGDFMIKDVRFNWNVGGDLSVEEYKYECENDLLLASSAGLRISFPSTLMFYGSVSFNDNDYYQNESDSVSNKYHLEASIELVKDLNLSFSYDQNDCYYADGDNDYFEIVMSGRVICKF